MPRMQRLPLAYVVDPTDPRAPSQELWDRLSESERERIVQSLPTGEMLLVPEGLQHFLDKTQVFDTLRRHFGRINRRIFVASEIAVSYPAQRLFCPDIVAVVDVDPHPRSRWVVSREGRGVDFVLECVSESNRDKDLRRNVEWFPTLGIPEYFVYDRPERKLHGFRLRPGSSTYERIKPLGSGYPSSVLGLDLTLEGERLRFRHGFAALPDSDELITRLDTALGEVLSHHDEATARAIAAEAQAAANAAQAAANAAQAAAAEARLAEALAELERLRSRSAPPT